MIYATVTPDYSLDQGDLIDECPILYVRDIPPVPPADWDLEYGRRRIVVLTQTCDLANQKATLVTVAEVVDAQELVRNQILKAADVRGPLRAGRIWGLYFLPADATLGLGEMIVDLRRVHTVRPVVLMGLCRDGKRRARLPVPYREHLAKHFADTDSRIGLPRPYETL